jgi:hypothetical protein
MFVEVIEGLKEGNGVEGPGRCGGKEERKKGV